MKEIGARFSNSEYLKVSFDFSENEGECLIETPEGAETYTIGGESGGDGGDDTPIPYTLLTMTDGENDDILTGKTTTEAAALLANGEVIIGVYDGTYRALGVVSMGQGGNIFCAIGDSGIINGTSTGFLKANW